MPEFLRRAVKARIGHVDEWRLTLFGDHDLLDCPPTLPSQDQDRFTPRVDVRAMFQSDSQLVDFRGGPGPTP
jgi:hypothetical protein